MFLLQGWPDLTHGPLFAHPWCTVCGTWPDLNVSQLLCWFSCAAHYGDSCYQAERRKWSPPTWKMQSAKRNTCLFHRGEKEKDVKVYKGSYDEPLSTVVKRDLILQNCTAVECKESNEAPPEYFFTNKSLCWNELVCWITIFFILTQVWF